MSRIAAILLFVNLVPLSSHPATASSPWATVGSRSTLQAVGANGPAADYAVELNATNFDAALGGTPATYAVVEFFAHWCPACRNYKPQYEKVARLFNGPDAVHPGIVLMTRIDCALKINNELCDKFSVSHYPMLFWGPPSKFVAAGWELKQEKSKIHVIHDGRTAERLLNWMNQQIGSSYALDDEKFENEHLSSIISDPEQVARAKYDVGDATSTASDIIFRTQLQWAKKTAAAEARVAAKELEREVVVVVAEDGQLVAVGLQKEAAAVEG